MGKLKTRKSITKRMKLTKNKKLVRRAANQNHFNARANGNATRRKHVEQNIHLSDVKKLIKQI
ncbi:MAG: 50S ribosomal protein L35 [Patescibacteria group bacterium]